MPGDGNMGLKSLFSARQATRPRVDGSDYIDLEEYSKGTELTDSTASMTVKVAEIHKYDDLRTFANFVYQGNLVLLDISNVMGDDIVMRRITGDLKKLVSDINGDLAGLGKSMLIIAPTGVRVDRHKAKGGSK
ncbi:MAG: cell division protein SepF [Thermoplasmatota archaeon]